MRHERVPLALKAPVGGLIDPRRIFREFASNLTDDQRAFFLAAIDAPDNSLYEDFIRPRLLTETYYTYTALSVREEDQRPAWNPGYTQEILDAHGPDGAQSHVGVFTNPLRWPSYDAVARRWSGPPRKRATNAGYCVYTFELDKLAGADRPGLVRYMLDRIRGGVIHKLDRKLKRFFDYRGLSVVYSGGKSFHVHLVFDLRHLRRNLAYVGNSKYKERWTCDVPDEFLRAAHAEYFNRLRHDFDEAIGERLEFDPNLGRWEQPRRCPYGLRKVEPEHPLGLPEMIDGEPLWIPQLVVQSRLSLKSPYRATRALHQSEEMIEIGLRAQQAASGPRPHRSLSSSIELDRSDPDGTDPFGAILAGILPEGMTYAGADHSGPDVRFLFHNGPADTHPSSVMRGEHDGILLQGAHQFGQDVVDLGVTANQLDRDCADMPKAIPLQDRHWFERDFREAATTPEGAREFLRHVPNIVRDNPRILLKAPEGIGKSSAFIHGMDRLIAAVQGDVVFVSPSYRQAEEKLDEFNRYWAGSRIRGFLMESVSHLYERVAASIGVKPITRTRALELGYESWLRCIEEQQPEVFRGMLSCRAELLRLRENQDHVVLFGVHDIVRQFRFAPLSWAFYTPEFDAVWRGEGEEGLSIEGLARKSQPRLVIYDELTAKDLLDVHRRDHVEWVRGRQRSRQGWDNLNQIERYAAYREDIAKHPCEDLTWERFAEIASLGFGREDARRVNIDHELPFDDRNGMYAQTHGDLVYVKQRAWWNWFGYVVMLTTEQLPTEIIRKIDKSARQTRTGDRDDRFVVLEFDLPGEHQDVVYLEPNRLCKKATLGELERLYRERYPEIQVVSDMLDQPEVRTHYSTRGMNDLSEKDIIAFYTAIDPQQFWELAAINSAFDLRCAVRLTYVDRLNQTTGRNRGYRGGHDREHIAVMSLRLKRWLYPFLLAFTRYQLVERKPFEVSCVPAEPPEVPSRGVYYTSGGLTELDREIPGDPLRGSLVGEAGNAK